MIQDYQWLIVKIWKDKYEYSEKIEPIEEQRFISVEEMLKYLQDKKGKKFSIHGENCLLDWG